MRLLILRSRPAAGHDEPTDPYVQEFRSRFADRVIGNLRGDAGFCSSCGPDCTDCRRGYNRRFASSIAAVIDLPAALPYLLERPAEHLPAALPPHDVAVAINIHEQVLLEFIKRCGESGTRGIVAPLEARDWVSGAARQEAHEICERLDIPIEFPKPFCDLAPPAGSVLDEFRRRFHVGRPEVELTVADGIIEKAHVHVSAACGATYYVARWLVGRSVADDLAHEVIAKRLHSYPCTASMAWDDELGDTVMHVAGEAHYAILAPLGDQGHGRKVEMIASPVGGMIPKPLPPKDNIANIERAKAAVLADLARDGRASLRELTGRPDTSPAAMSSAILLLKQDGAIRIDGDTVLPC